MKWSFFSKEIYYKQCRTELLFNQIERLQKQVKAMLNFVELKICEVLSIKADNIAHYYSKIKTNIKLNKGPNTKIY